MAATSSPDTLVAASKPAAAVKDAGTGPAQANALAARNRGPGGGAFPNGAGAFPQGATGYG